MDGQARFPSAIFKTSLILSTCLNHNSFLFSYCDILVISYQSVYLHCGCEEIASPQPPISFGISTTLCTAKREGRLIPDVRRLYMSAYMN